MDRDLTVREIYRIFEGEHTKGYLKPKANGRGSDCFVLFKSGRADYLLEDDTLSVTEGSVFYLSRGSYYAIDVLEDCSFLCIDFDFFEQNGVRKCEIFREISFAAKQDFERIFATYMKKSPHSRAHTLCVLYRIYTEIIRAQNRAYAKVDRLFSPASAYVLAHYTDPSLSVADIAKSTGVSEVHLRRVFRDALGMSPVKYINFVRIEKAKGLLTVAETSVGEIAAAVGFEDPYYFSRLFHAQVGVSPAKYRQSHGKEAYT